MSIRGWEIKKNSVMLTEATIQEEVLYLWYKIWIKLVFLLSWCLWLVTGNSKTLQNAVISVFVGTKKNTTLKIPLAVSLSQSSQPAPKWQSRCLLLVIKA